MSNLPGPVTAAYALGKIISAAGSSSTLTPKQKTLARIAVDLGTQRLKDEPRLSDGERELQKTLNRLKKHLPIEGA